MKEYYGTKLIKAEPQNKNGDEGMRVIYSDGYESWSPMKAFEAYHDIHNLLFGHAIEALKAGERVARWGWSGENMFLYLVEGSRFKVNRPPLLGIYPEGTEIDYLPHIDMKTTNGSCVPWLASQGDMLAGDWYILSEDGTDPAAR